MTCGSFGAAGMLCPGLAIDAVPILPSKPLIVSGGLAHRITCLPVWIEFPCDGMGGYDYSCPTFYTTDPETGQATETEMSATFNPGAAPEAETDKETLTGFSIEGPAAAQPLDTIIADALAASAVTDFSIEGSAITAEDIKECGTLTIATKDGRRGIVVNGDTDFPVASWTWDGGIGGLDTVEVLEGCEALALACAKKNFIPTKV